MGAAGHSGVEGKSQICRVHSSPPFSHEEALTGGPSARRRSGQRLC